MDNAVIPFHVKRLTKTARLPEKAGVEEAGIDFFADEDVFLGNSPSRISTGVAVEIPQGWCLVLKDRSSLASRGVHVLGGVIDSSYRGDVQVVMLSLSTPVYGPIKRGDKICQGVLVPVPYVHIREVEELSDTQRGVKGFGSTGK